EKKKMASYQNRPGAQATDEYGNPIQQLDEYGNPIGGGGYGTAGGAGGRHHGQQQLHEESGGGRGLGGMLHRSGSGSSSSSEDDGQGGRRKKKGITDKIKEKLPGHHDQSSGHLKGWEWELPLVMMLEATVVSATRRRG
ncbi:hypothetical protein HID58_095911, partial [Brassica napus]